MRLEGAKKKTKSLGNFLLLNHFLQIHEDSTMTSTNETTQNSLRLMDELRTTRLFTFPTTGADKKLTQRLTNLCVSVTSMPHITYMIKHQFDYNLRKFIGKIVQ